MKKRHAFTVALGVLGIAGLVFGASYAFADTKQSFGPRHEERQAMRDALEAGDYDAFVKATADLPKPDDAPAITEAIFEKMVEAHKLRQAGDLDGARAIMEELGFPFKRSMTPPGAMRGPKFENLTDEQKDAMQKAHELFRSGDEELAKATLEDAGLELPPFRGMKKE